MLLQCNIYGAFVPPSWMRMVMLLLSLLFRSFSRASCPAGLLLYTIFQLQMIYNNTPSMVIVYSDAVFVMAVIDHDMKY